MFNKTYIHKIIAKLAYPVCYQTLLDDEIDRANAPIESLADDGGRRLRKVVRYICFLFK